MAQPYGYQPMPPPAAWQPAARPPRPRTVDIAFGLMLVTVVIRVIGIVVAVGSRDEVRRILRDREPGLSPSDVDRFANLGVDVAIGVGIVFAAFYLFLAWKVYAGKNWARITAWVFCGLAVLGTLLEFAQANTGITKALGVLEGLIAVAIIVLLALAPSNEYFRKRLPMYGYYPPPV